MKANPTQGYLVLIIAQAGPGVDPLALMATLRQCSYEVHSPLHRFVAEQSLIG